MGKCGCFLPRGNSHLSPQLGKFRLSWSSAKMLGFQPRGFVFEPVRVRYFLCKHSEAKRSPFPIFRHHEISPFSAFFKTSKPVCLRQKLKPLIIKTFIRFFLFHLFCQVLFAPKLSELLRTFFFFCSV